MFCNRNGATVSEKRTQARLRHAVADILIPRKWTDDFWELKALCYWPKISFNPGSDQHLLQWEWLHELFWNGSRETDHSRALLPHCSLWFAFVYSVTLIISSQCDDVGRDAAVEAEAAQCAILFSVSNVVQTKNQFNLTLSRIIEFLTTSLCEKTIYFACSAIHCQNAYCNRFHVLLPTFDLHIRHLWVDTEGQVTGQCPGCGCPGNQGHVLILHQWKVNNDGWILNVLVGRNQEIQRRLWQFVYFSSDFQLTVLHRWHQPCSSGGTQSWTGGCCRQSRMAWPWLHGKPDPCRRAAWTPTYTKRWHIRIFMFTLKEEMEDRLTPGKLSWF